MNHIGFQARADPHETFVVPGGTRLGTEADVRSWLIEAHATCSDAKDRDFIFETLQDCKDLTGQYVWMSWLQAEAREQGVDSTGSCGASYTYQRSTKLVAIGHREDVRIQHQASFFEDALMVGVLERNVGSCILFPEP